MLQISKPLMLAGAAALGVAGSIATFAYGFGLPHPGGSDDALARKVQAAFPNTKVGSVKCGLAAGMCEVTAGKNVFYVSPDGRYAIVGSVLDLKDRVNLTDRRIKELSALDAATATINGPTTTTLADASAQAAAPMGVGGAGVAPAHPPTPAMADIKVDLPVGNAIVHHAGAPLKVAVFTDLNCGYCRMLMEAIKTAPDIQVTEYPMQLLRPDSLNKAKLALCAHDREATANSIYFGGDVKVQGDCKAAVEAVEANTAFARAHGIQGTPTIVRADGKAAPGFMPVDQLRAWLKEAKA